MNLKELKEIIDIFESRDSINELEIEKSGVRLRMKRVGESAGVAPVLTASPAVAHPVALPAQAAASRTAEGEDLVLIKSPIVGTFYKSPKPTSPPFVSVGDFVEKGTILCIIEAMKLMNEIESEVAGVVSAVLVENGQPVEYGEELFAIKPR